MKKIILLIALVTMVVTRTNSQTSFITTWDLGNPGFFPTQISFGVNTTGIATYSWTASPSGSIGTGTFTGTSITITGLPISNVITLSISPTNFNRININYGDDKDRLTNVNQWGTTAWSTMQNAFYGCRYLNITSTDIPNLSGVSDMSRMFLLCDVLNGPTNIGTWNTAAVTNMYNMFAGDWAFNQPIGTWNTSAVTDMNGMFMNAGIFNQAIGTWNTSAVTDMNRMFAGAHAFNQPIGTWNTAAVTNMNGMFAGAYAFNQPIGTWNTAAVTDMNGMFKSASAFNQPIGSWNTANVTNMYNMFNYASAFNQPIGTWNTAAVTDMNGMFAYTTAFNQPIGTWNTAAVTDMHDMFEGAQAFNQPIGTWNTAAVINMSRMFSMFASVNVFNQPIGTWNTAAVTDMHNMFAHTTAFNQPIGTWNTTAVNNMSNMFESATAFNQPIGTWTLAPTVNLSIMLSNCGMDCNNYSATLNGWASNTLTPNGRNLGANGLNYASVASVARNTLISSKMWAIFGDYANISPTVSVNSGTICSGNSFTIVPSGAITYSYSSGSAVVSPTASTSYSVIGISTAGCSSSNTAISSVTVNPILPMTVLGTNSVCIGTSNSYTATGATTYTWSTGAISPSITVSPTVSTTYSVIGLDALGCSRAGTVNLIVDNTCADVWPGDANSDGVADNLDVLELGLHYTQTGPARAITSNLWHSYFSNNWIGTITGGKNLNHSDCNGDGIIDANDTLAIYNNYGLTHAFRPEFTTLTDPQLSIVSDQGYVEKGKWGSASIYLGDATAPINTINGVAFTLNFDNALIETDSIYLTYLPSFIDAGNNLRFRKRDFVNNKLYTTTTHTNNINVSGYGKIAIINYKIKSSLISDLPLNFSISQGVFSNASGSIIPLTTGTSSVLAVGASVGITSYDNSGKIIIYPNPAKDVLYFETNALKENMSIIVYNAFGQIVLKESIHSNKSKLAINSLANGVYFIDVLTNETSISKTKFVKE